MQLLHGALRQCLGLIHCVILKEDEEWGEQEGDYETMRKNVRLRLEHLLRTTKDLAETDDTTLEVTPDHQCTEVQDVFVSVFLLLESLFFFSQKCVVLHHDWNKFVYLYHSFPK